MSGSTGSEICSTFVEALGLKTLFAAFMGKASFNHSHIQSMLISWQTSKKQKHTASTQATEDASHILGIISSLFTNLPSDSSDRIRLLAKFVENNYEKVDKLLEMREHASSRLKVVDSEIETEKKVFIVGHGDCMAVVGSHMLQVLLAEGTIEPENEELWYLQRLDGGLFILQTLDYILAWVAMEDDGVRTIIHYPFPLLTTVTLGADSSHQDART